MVSVYLSVISQIIDKIEPGAAEEARFQ